MQFKKEKKTQVNFYFKEVSLEDLQKQIWRLDNKKASQNFNIPTKIIKENADIFAEYFCSSVNGLIKSSIFPSCLKVADIISIHGVHKKDKKDTKENYRSVSILPVISKIFGKSLFIQMSHYWKDIFDK